MGRAGVAGPSQGGRAEPGWPGGDRRSTNEPVRSVRSHPEWTRATRGAVGGWLVTDGQRSVAERAGARPTALLNVPLTRLGSDFVDPGSTDERGRWEPSESYRETALPGSSPRRIMHAIRPDGPVAQVGQVGGFPGGVGHRSCACRDLGPAHRVHRANGPGQHAPGVTVAARRRLRGRRDSAAAGAARPDSHAGFPDRGWSSDEARHANLTRKQ